MQAHWSGLFPDRTIPEFDRSGYKRFNRHWEDDLDMFRLKFKMQPGSWFVFLNLITTIHFVLLGTT